MLWLLLACSDPPPPDVHTLKDLFRPVLQLNTGNLPGGPEQVQLFVHPEFPGLCHPIPTLKATLDGKEMTRLHGKVEGPPPYDRDCSVFEFTLDAKEVAVGPTTEVVVTDGTTTLKMVAAGVFVPRTVTPSTTRLKTGDSLTLAWSPPTDVPTKTGELGVELKGDGDERAVLKRKDLVIGAGTLSFTLPPKPIGDVTLSVYGTANMQPAVTTCEGAAKCGVSRAYDVEPVKLEVAPGPVVPEPEAKAEVQGEAPAPASTASAAPAAPGTPAAPAKAPDAGTAK